MKNIFRSVLTRFALFAIALASLFGQTEKAQLSGTITDKSEIFQKLM
jgi:hypothetical protein